MSSSSIEPRSVGSLGMMEVVAPGIFGTTVVQNGKPIHLRMELLTKENEKRWGQFKSLTSRHCGECRGIFTTLVIKVCKFNRFSSHLDVAEATGFSEEEHEAFLQKIVSAKKRTDGKIATHIRSTESASSAMLTSSSDNSGHYIIYATRNPKFSIPDAKSPPDYTLKNWIVSYKDILICAGTDFSHNETSFHTRGIFRNPYWVLKGKYSGLSMMLHGFSGAVAQTYSPKKEQLIVSPLGSMFCLFKKYLQRGEGTLKGAKDVVDIEAQPDDPEIGLVAIAVPALVRIFNNSISREVP